MVIDPWTVYWQGDHLESCISSKSPEDSKEIAIFWQQLASRLTDASTVLDLACGNGAIAKQLLSINSTLKICAVDKAQIAPHKYLSQAGELASVRFMPETDICDLPFKSNSFDVVISQFGLEYAPLTEACQSAARVLKSHGKIQLLMHHEDSEILRPTTATLSEIARLLEDQGVIVGIENYLEKKIDLSQLESIGQQYLEANAPSTKQISGQIFAGINQIIDEMKTNPGQARVLLENMNKKLLADQARLQQLWGAALGKEQVFEFEQSLMKSGIDIKFFKPFTIDDEEAGKILIGWQLSGSKK